MRASITLSIIVLCLVKYSVVSLLFERCLPYVTVENATKVENLNFVKNYCDNEYCFYRTCGQSGYMKGHFFTIILCR